jgi:tight adherence protein B
MGVIVLMVGLSALAASGVMLAFAVLAFAPPSEDAGGASGLRGQLDGAFQAVAERVSERERRKGRPALQERLGRAGMRLKPGEYIMVQLGCALVLALLCLLRFGVGLVPIVGALIGLMAPGFYLKFRTGRRLKRLNNQLIDVLSLMSNSLKAGHSLPQTLDLIAKDSRPPISEEFARCVRELQVGGSLEGALASLARRSGSEDLELMVTAVLVQISVGGNLAGMLEKIAHTVRERVRIKGEISAATAQGRMSGWVVTLMPVGVAVILFVISPSYFRPMVQQVLGWLMLGAAGFLILVGNLFISKIVKIDV